MPDPSSLSVARRLPRPRVQAVPAPERQPAVLSLPGDTASREAALPLHAEIPSLEYWLDMNA